METGRLTGAGKDCKLAIVPVQVKLEKSNKTVTTYAFLDPGSSATFCTERLMKQLEAKGKKTRILLRTMGQEKTVESHEIIGLEVGHIEGGTFLSLPKVYTQTIPVTKTNIVTSEDIKRWTYLDDIHLTHIDADVELLIGVNAPKAMEPWQVINSQDDGPYAVRTHLGWVVNGPLNGYAADQDAGHQKVFANRISVASLEEVLTQQYNHDFSERQYEGESELSVEDRKFIDIVSKSVSLQDGHYYLPLPFRKKEVAMPNNRHMAEQRALYLQKRFKRDEKFLKGS